MAARNRRSGKFKLFVTSNGNRILRLRGEIKGWYAWAGGDRTDLLILTDGNHERERTEREGRYHYVEFQDDPGFQDQPHLFLKKSNGRFDHMILPQGLPRQDDYRRPVIHVDEDLPKGKVREHVHDGGVTLPLNNYDNRNAAELRGMVQDLERSELEQLRAYEQQHKQRKSVLAAIDREL